MVETRGSPRYRSGHIGHLRETTTQQAVRAVAADEGIRKRVTTHTFRHSIATHLPEAGTDIRTVQEPLGPRDFKPIMIYTLVSKSGPTGSRAQPTACRPLKLPQGPILGVMSTRNAETPACLPVAGKGRRILAGPAPSRGRQSARAVRVQLFSGGSNRESACATIPSASLRATEDA